MALNGSQQAIIDKRRTLVARARLKGATQREIVEALAKQRYVNPDTGKPWSLGTINYDLRAIRKQWREDAKQDISEYTADQLAELREVRRKAWQDNDLSVVLKSLAQESKLLGTDAPTKTELTGKDGEAMRVEYVNDWRSKTSLPAPWTADGQGAGAAVQLASSGETVEEDDPGHGDSG